MSHLIELRDILKQFTGQANIISVSVPMIDFTGSIEAALLLSQIIFWCDRTKNDDGWFYKSYAEWFEEIRLSEYQVRKIVKRFESQGMVNICKRKILGAPTLHYQLNWDVFSECFLEFLQLGTQKNLTLEPEETSGSNPKKLQVPTQRNSIFLEPEENSDSNLKKAQVPYKETDPTNRSHTDPTEIKDPPQPPQGGKGGLKNFQQPEQPTALTAIADILPTAPTVTATAISETRLISEQPQTSNGQGQSSAARREPKSIRNVRRHYGECLPPWRVGWGVGNYTPEILSYTAQYLSKLPSNSAIAQYTPIQLLEEYEEKERWANLESRATNLANGHDNNGSICARYLAEIPCPSDSEWYMENQKLDLADDLTLMRIHWERLGLEPEDSRWANWLSRAAPELDPSSGINDLPTWIIPKLATDLQNTYQPC
jgi:hypothetical protein